MSETNYPYTAIMAHMVCSMQATPPVAIYKSQLSKTCACNGSAE